jgi:LPXTG-motif cell wall-anchored protein
MPAPATVKPKATKNADNTKGIDYLYYIKEVGVNGYLLESATNNDGTNTGTIKLVNRAIEGYILPETGGTGTQLYTMAGLLLVVISTAFLMYNHTKRRREDYDSS